MRREIRTFALAAAAALLLVAPATLTFATSPLRVPTNLSAPSTSWTSTFREAKIVQMTLLDDRQPGFEPLTPSEPLTQAIDIGSRYDGKQLPA